MRILGIDPGFERLGIAVLESAQGTAPAKSGGQGSASSRKELVVFSECFKTSSKLDFAERLKLLGEEVKRVIKIVEVSPPQIKMATTGYGRADKEQIMKMVRILVEIDKSKTSDDELDAIAIALTAFAHIRN